MVIAARSTPLPMDAVDMYLDEVSNHPLLTAQDEVDLALKIERGKQAKEKLENTVNLDPISRLALRRRVREGEKAKEVFIQSNLRLVISIAKRYAGRGMDLIDMIQEGNLGLIRAVEKFDWRKGFKFSTYATWWIRQAITRGLGNQSRTIRLPVHLADIVRTVNETIYTLTERLQRRPTSEEIATASGLEIDKVKVALSTPLSTTYIDRPISEDGDAVLGDFVEDKTATDPFVYAARSVRQTKIDEALGLLSQEERRVLIGRFGLEGKPPLTLTDIATDLGATREHVRQIERRALAKLRHPCNSHGLKYLINL
ncbi:MAG: sigma-70 family RNA polymerase sigma factor [Acidimicrobiia bacterium]|nr:sigma-70 family RNA polymerase sigma factor [Acidimicrobiia bacterium]